MPLDVGFTQQANHGKRKRRPEAVFSDLGATAEQTLQEVRGFEENYYALVHAAMRVFPWLDDFNQKLQGYIEQNFAAANEFSRDLTQAKDTQDFIRVCATYNRKCFQLFTTQVRDFAEICTNLMSGATKSTRSLFGWKIVGHLCPNFLNLT